MAEDELLEFAGACLADGDAQFAGCAAGPEGLWGGGDAAEGDLDAGGLGDRIAEMLEHAGEDVACGR